MRVIRLLYTTQGGGHYDELTLPEPDIEIDFGIAK